MVRSKFAPQNKENGFSKRTGKVRKMSVNFRGGVWYVVLLTKGRVTGGSKSSLQTAMPSRGRTAVGTAWC